jgi:hypothetical protein
MNPWIIVIIAIVILILSIIVTYIESSEFRELVSWVFRYFNSKIPKR